MIFDRLRKVFANPQNPFKPWLNSYQIELICFFSKTRNPL
jgi:hypothetical protein